MRLMSHETLIFTAVSAYEMHHPGPWQLIVASLNLKGFFLFLVEIPDIHQVT